MCNSYINAAKILNFQLKIATPFGFEPDKSTLDLAKNNVELCDLPGKAVEDCDLVTTDVWSSMGDEGEAEKRKALFRGYQINKHLCIIRVAESRNASSTRLRVRKLAWTRMASNLSI